MSLAATIRSVEKNQTPLELAIQNREVPTALNLIKNGAKLKDASPFFYSIIANNLNPALLEALLPSVDKNKLNSPCLLGQTMLTAAAKNGNLSAVVSLVKARADVNAPNSRMQTPLYSAVLEGASLHTEELPGDALSRISQIAQYLIANGASVDSRDDQRKTALEAYITLWSPKKYPELVTILAEESTELPTTEQVKYLIGQPNSAPLEETVNSAILIAQLRKEARIKEAVSR